MGFDAFATAAREAGVSGVLLTDVLPGEEPGLEDALHRNGLARIVLVAPTTPPARARALAAQASGFIYVIARRGVTGAGAAESEAPALVATLREVTDVPVYVGFGVSTRTDVETIHAYADGAIVGSALVLKLHQTPVNERAALAGAYLRGLLGAG
jgi:tryptophan synthase alpha chain